MMMEQRQVFLRDESHVSMATPMLLMLHRAAHDRKGKAYLANEAVVAVRLALVKTSGLLWAGQLP